MRTRIAVGATLLLTIGSAVAGSILYGQSRSVTAAPGAVVPASATEVTPEVIAMWKVKASSSGYVAPRLPI